MYYKKQYSEDFERLKVQSRGIHTVDLQEHHLEVRSVGVRCLGERGRAQTKWKDAGGLS